MGWRSLGSNPSTQDAGCRRSGLHGGSRVSIARVELHGDTVSQEDQPDGSVGKDACTCFLTEFNHQTNAQELSSDPHTQVHSACLSSPHTNAKQSQQLEDAHITNSVITVNCCSSLQSHSWETIS